MCNNKWPYFFCFTAAPRFVQSPEDQQIILSTVSPLGSLTLICDVYAIPEATITWMHIPSNGEAIVLTDSLERIDIEQNQEGYTTFSTLTFANVTFADRGEFRCTADNEYNTISSNASLVVYGKNVFLKVYNKALNFYQNQFI